MSSRIKLVFKSFYLAVLYNPWSRIKIKLGPRNGARCLGKHISISSNIASPLYFVFRYMEFSTVSVFRNQNQIVTTARSCNEEQTKYGGRILNPGTVEVQSESIEKDPREY